jgi:hypothetical protein
VTRAVPGDRPIKPVVEMDDAEVFAHRDKRHPWLRVFGSARVLRVVLVLDHRTRSVTRNPRLRPAHTHAERQ